MRKVILILLIFVCKLSDAQVYQLMPQYGYDAKRMKFDSTLHIPTTCGVPTLRSTYTKYSAIAFDTCNNRFYVYNSKTLVWDTLKGGTGGGGSTDTTSLSNRINNAYTTITKLTDTSFFLTKPNTLKDTIRFNKDVVYTENPILTRVSNDSTIIYLNADSLSSWRNTGYVPYVGATQDVDLDANKISARSVYIEGTNGNGHLHLKHQNADATATGQSTSLYADSNGDIKWKNDGYYYTTLKTSNNTANRIYTYPDTSTTLIGASDTSVFQRKNIAAYSFKANNTNATANMTDQVFKDSTYKNLTSTITFGGTTPPTTALNTVYKFVQIGKMVIAYFFFNYSTSSTGLSSITFDLPSDMPAPSSWGITPAASSFYQNAGYLTSRLSLTSTSGTHNNIPISFRRNSGNTGWEIFSNFASSSIRVFYITLNYFTD